MDRRTAEAVVRVMDLLKVSTLDLTGGAPEMNPHFRHLVSEARQLGVRVIDRCNLTILEEEGYHDMAAFLAAQRVDVVASLPCYQSDNVDAQRGKGTFDTSIRALKRLNDLGYGVENSGLKLTLVYNPQGARLPPSQAELEAAYKRELHLRFGIVFNHLFTITNMPIQRFGSTLISHGEFGSYMQLLKEAYSEENLSGVMCRSLISIDWQGYVYDCDFNQAAGLPIKGEKKRDIFNTEPHELLALPVATGEHCFGCTAGSGSGCRGAIQ